MPSRQPAAELLEELKEAVRQAGNAQEAVNALGAGPPGTEPFVYQIGPARFQVPRRAYLGWGFRRRHEHKDIFGLAIGRYPLRKKVALFADAGGCSVPLAYFRSEAHAQLAMVLLNTLITRQEPEPVQAGEA